MNQQEKKRAHYERILQIDHGTFTTLVFPIKGSIERECQKTYLLLALINLKRESLDNRFQVIGFDRKFALGC